jgi:four helix bundle protein
VRRSVGCIETNEFRKEQKDFQHKLKVCFKELNESRVWLKILIKSKMVKQEKMSSLYQECDELCRIINASIKTSRKNQTQTG